VAFQQLFFITLSLANLINLARFPDLRLKQLEILSLRSIRISPACPLMGGVPRAGCTNLYLSSRLLKGISLIFPHRNAPLIPHH
jgi:hypothetical protein